MTAKGYHKPRDHTYISKQRIAAVLFAARSANDHAAYFLFALQYLLGLRIGEVILLRYEHLGPLNRFGMPEYVNVPTLKKDPKKRDAPLWCEATNKPLYPVPILSHPNIIKAAFDPAFRRSKSPWLFPGKGGKDATRHMCRSYAIQRFNALRDRACLPDYLSTHALRVAAGSDLYAKCQRRRVVSLFLRHKFGSDRDADGAAVTDRYIHTLPEEWARYRGALDLPPLAPIPGTL